MMVYSRTRRFPLKTALIAALFVLFAFSALMFALLSQNTDARAELLGADLAAEYAYGTELEIPQATLGVNGKQLATESIVNFPGGSSYRKTTVVLNEMGKYTVEYRAQDGDREYREFKTFSVYRNLFDIEGGVGASATYTPSPLAPETQGINVRFTSGSTFYYHQVIDLNALDGNTPFVTAFISPEQKGVIEGYTLYFRLTDIYDPENYVTFRCNSSRAGMHHGVTYILCGGADQALTGVEWGWNRVHVNNIFGYPVNCSFYAQTTAEPDLPAEKNQLTLYFDNETMIAKADRSSSYIVDLDDPTYFTDPFTGFTTGEVTLSVWADDYLKSSFGLEITSVADHDISADRLADTEGPEITVDYGDYDEAPRGLAGYDYPLFEATAYDVYSGEEEVRANVYMNYYDADRTDCYVENGVFKPLLPGTYIIEYSATDDVGNVSVKTVEIEVRSQAAAVEVSVDENEQTESGYVGTRIPIASANVIGGIGETSMHVVVTDMQGKEAVCDGMSFITESAGTYLVKYIASDFVNQQDTYEYQVNVTINDAPVFGSDPMLPQTVFTDFEYTLPALQAYSYAGGKHEAEVTVSVEDAAGRRELGPDLTVMFSANSDADEVTVTYTAVDGDKRTSASYTLDCVRAKDEEGRLELSNYFSINGFEVTPGDSYTAFTADGSVPVASLQFRNYLLDDDLSLNFNVDTAKNKFSSLTVRLTDSLGTSVTAVLSKEGTSVRLSVGTMSMLMTQSFTDSLRSGFNFLFDQENKRLTADGVNYLPVLATEDGSVFEGFSGHMVYLSVEMQGISGESALQIISINSQEITNTPLDIVRPRIYIEGVYGGAYDIGEEVVLNMAYAADVVDPNPTLTVRVTDPDGQVVTSTDGEVLDNVPVVYGQTIRLDKYGSYRVLYTSTDASGRGERTVSYNISVIDAVAPVITLQAAMKSEYKLGDTVVIPQVTLSDNESAAENIRLYKYLVLPSGRIVEIPGNSFIASYIGNIAVRYVAFDEAGNQTICEIAFTCA